MNAQFDEIDDPEQVIVSGIAKIQPSLRGFIGYLMSGTSDIDEVRILSSALSAKEIRWLMEGSK